MTTWHYATKLPKLVKVDLSQRLFPRQKMAYDNKHRLVIVDDGVEDVQASIEAASCVSLSELCAGMPGRSPLEKLNNALESGLLGDVKSTSGDVVQDLTEIPTSLGDIVNTQAQARAAAGGKSGDLTHIINQIVKEALAQQASAAKTSDTAKGEDSK